MNIKQAHIGCSGYHYKDWRGKFYPEEMKQDEWLTYYADTFSSVEINNSFYKIPDAGTFETWKEETPRNFRFTLKGSRYITHMKKLKDPGEHVHKFFKAIGPIAEKTTCILWQLPGNQHFDSDKLAAFCKLLTRDFLNVIEFRHTSWFTEETYEILSNHHHMAACSLSAPGDLPEDLLEINGVAYIRFHGKKDWYNYRYSDQELDEWVKKVKATEGIDQLYAYFNNDVDANAPVNARKFKLLVEEG